MLWYILTEPHQCATPGCLGRVVSRHHKMTRPVLEKWNDQAHKVYLGDTKQLHTLMPRPGACLKPIVAFREVDKKSLMEGADRE